jgi:replicative DNA helicase
MSSTVKRVLPHNLDAEASVLGGILLRNEVLATLDKIEVEDFYDPRHQAVFAAMQALEAGSRPIDEVTLEAQLQQMGKLEAVGGLAYLSQLGLRVPTADNVVHYANIVQELNSARRLMLTASEIAARGYEDYGEIEEYLDEAEAKIFEVTQRTQRGNAEHIKNLLKQVFGSLDQRFRAAGGITGVPSGFRDLDEKTAGFQPTELTILAARPAMGKTSFAMSIARNCATTHGFPVLVFSLEMSSGQLAERLLCAEAKIDSIGLRRGQLQRQDLTNMTYAADALSKAPIVIDDTGALTLRELRASARRFMSDKELKKEKQFGLIIIDYLQLMSGRRDRSTSREQEISEISRGLKAMAKELHCPIMALSQLNRGLESRENKRPQLSDLRECVTGDTLVVLADGRRVPIAELAGQTPRVLAMTPDGRIAPADSDRVWRVGVRPVFDVALKSGRHIRATGKHRLYGAGGWRRVTDLAPGDRLAIARTLPETEEPSGWPERRVALLGHLIGDGSYLSGQPMRYATASPENSDLVASAAQAEFGCEVKRYKGRGQWHQLLISGNGSRWRPAGVNAWLRQLGIFGQRSHEKRIPHEAFRLPRAQVALLLQHLWATDGCIWISRDSTRAPRGRIYFSTSSRALALDVAALLLRLDIVARIRSTPHATARTVFSVDVSGADQQRRFLRVVGAFGPRELTARRLGQALESVRDNTNVDTLPRAVFDRVKDLMATRGITQRQMASLRGTSYGGSSHFAFAPSRGVVRDYAELLDDAVLHAACASDLFWDEIVSIEPAGEEEVFDLTVPGPASWLADGIVSHNSGAIEQDADLILFIYRDEVYNKETEEKNIAEIIIGKNRHGPIDTIKTRFDGRYTRFENLSHREPGDY